MLFPGSTSKSLQLRLICLTGLACSFFVASASVAVHTPVSEKQMLKQDAASQENNNVIKKENFTFNLQNCQQNTQSKVLDCQLLITATSEKNTSITIFHNTENASPRVFDLSGNEYISNFIQIGTSKSTVSNSRAITKELIPGIPTNGT